jgi:ADP-ribose pyrophosphatase YjhB (NUDIX family)
MPNEDSYWFIGGRERVDEDPVQAAVRCFKRETKVEISGDRLTPIGIFIYAWRNRAQEPTNLGCCALGITFALPATPEEIARAARGLEAKEYYADEGFREFNRNQLVELTEAGRLRPTVLAAYDHCFPPAT